MRFTERGNESDLPRTRLFNDYTEVPDISGFAGVIYDAHPAGGICNIVVYRGEEEEDEEVKEEGDESEEGEENGGATGNDEDVESFHDDP